jgi:hypothetical protein
MAAKDQPKNEPKKKVTRDDLEAKFRSLQGDVQGKVEDRKQTLTMAAVAGGVLLLLLVFLVGKRSGKKKTTLVEIRRV